MSCKDAFMTKFSVAETGHGERPSWEGGQLTFPSLPPDPESPLPGGPCHAGLGALCSLCPAGWVWTWAFPFLPMTARAGLASSSRLVSWTRQNRQKSEHSQVSTGDWSALVTSQRGSPLGGSALWDSEGTGTTFPPSRKPCTRMDGGLELANANYYT